MKVDLVYRSAQPVFLQRPKEAAVRLTRRAPLGDPLELSLRDTRLCLRRGEAALFPVTASNVGEQAQR